MKLILLSIIILFTNLIKAQTIVSNELFRKVYVGIENPISVVNLKIPSNNIILKSDVGLIRKVNNTRFTWRICNTRERFVYLKIYNKSTFIDSIAFKVDTIPNATILASSQDKEILFKESQGFRAEILDFIADGINVEIISFNITIVKTNGDTIRIENKGCYYNSIAKLEFDKLKIGDKVTLSEFIVKEGCEEKHRKLTTVLTSIYSGRKYESRF